ncbi:MAG: hypothetical protein ACRERE_00250 [Candidatus Entotheonellia bacterium]
MQAHGHTTVWGSHISVGRARHTAGRLQQLRAWWAAYTARRRHAKLAALNGCWDAKREVLQPLRAEAAPEMAAAQGALSMATQLYGLTL